LSELGDYNPPNKWVWDKENGGKFANINRPISGLPIKRIPLGKHLSQYISRYSEWN